MNEQQPLMGNHSHHVLTSEETYEVSGGQRFNELLDTSKLPDLGDSTRYHQDPQYPS